VVIKYNMDKTLIEQYIKSIPSISLTKNNNNSFLAWLMSSTNSIYDTHQDKDLLGYLFLGYHFSNQATKQLLNNVAQEKTLINKICHQYTTSTLLTELSLGLLAKPFKSYLSSKDNNDFINSQIVNMHQVLDHYSNQYPRKKKTIFLRNIHNFLFLGTLTFSHMKPEVALITTPFHMFAGMSVGPAIAKMATQGRYYGVVESYQKIFKENREKKFEFKKFSLLTEQLHDYIFLYNAFKLIGSLYKNNLKPSDTKLQDKDNSERPESLIKEMKQELLLTLCEKQYLENITSSSRSTQDAILDKNVIKKNKNNKI
jgi:hypothetical protein